MKKLQSLVAAAVLAALALGLGVEQTVVAQRVGAPGLTVGSPTPLLDGRTPVFIEHGADPTVAPGFDAPPGSIIKFGTAYYLRRGVNTGNATAATPTSRTDWELISPSRVATWSKTKVRYYLFDYDGGSDSNSCFVDATAGATLVPGSNACKTPEHLLQILPLFGNGRAAVVLMKPRAAGATYRNIANTADAGLDFSGLTGYVYFGLRGSTDLTNSVADRLTLGAIVAVAGPNGDSSYTVAAGATTSVFSVSAGSFGATDAAVGWRWRFASNTTTAALQNVSCFISANTGTQITCGGNLGTAPAAGDVGFVEQPGVRVGSYAGSMFQPAIVAGLAVSSTTFGALSISGGIYGNTFGTFASGSVGSISFVEQVGSSTTQVTVARTFDRFDILDTYTDEVGTSRVAGSGYRTASAFSVLIPGTASLSAAAFTNASANVIMTLGVQSNPIGSKGSYFAKGPTITVRGGTTSSVVIGTASGTERATRFVLGPLTLTGSGGIQNVIASNSASSGVVLNGTGSQVTLTTVTGTANATFGVDVSALVGSNVKIAADCTITGTSGDLKLAGAAPATIADLSLTNVVDASGNNVQGAAGSIVGQGRLVTNNSGGAYAVGSVVRNNGTSNQTTCAQADTVAHAGNAPCVMVTAAASTALGYMVCTGVPYVLYDGAPALAGPSSAYVSVGTACKATTTIPPVAATNQKLRLGFPYVTSGSAAYTNWQPEPTCVVADGAK